MGDGNLWWLISSMMAVVTLAHVPYLVHSNLSALGSSLGDSERATRQYAEYLIKSAWTVLVGALIGATCVSYLYLVASRLGFVLHL